MCRGRLHVHCSSRRQEALIWRGHLAQFDPRLVSVTSVSSCSIPNEWLAQINPENRYFRTRLICEIRNPWFSIRVHSCAFVVKQSFLRSLPFLLCDSVPFHFLSVKSV